MSTKIVTGKVRFSYEHIFTPQASDDGGDPKFSVTMLIPKSDTVTVNKIKAGIKKAADLFRSKNGAASLPQNPVHTLHDGDGVRASGDPFGPECKGCYVMTVSSKQKPVVVDAAKNEILDPTEVYSGCYGRVSFNLYAYSSHGKKGISGGLLAVQKLSDGEPLGTRGSASDFDDDFSDGDDDGWI